MPEVVTSISTQQLHCSCCSASSSSSSSSSGSSGSSGSGGSGSGGGVICNGVNIPAVLWAHLSGSYGCLGLAVGDDVFALTATQPANWIGPPSQWMGSVAVNSCGDCGWFQVGVDCTGITLHAAASAAICVAGPSGTADATSMSPVLIDIPVTGTFIGCCAGAAFDVIITESP